MISFPAVLKVTAHTRYVGPGSTFVAIKGTKEDGTVYIEQALKQGATTIVVAHDTVLSASLLEVIAHYNARLERVDNTRRALATMAAQAYNFPARRLRIIGVTGTKGKTTSVFLLHHILSSLGHKVALLSTVKNQIIDARMPHSLTTEQPDYLHAFFDICVTHGVEYVVMEVAAQALTMHRVEGIAFAGAIFTNIEPEHAEFYRTFEDYKQAKHTLVQYRATHAPLIINADDSHCAVLATQPHAYTYSIQSAAAAYYATDIAETESGTHWLFHTPTQAYQVYVTRAVGLFNVYNVLGVLTLLDMLGSAMAAAVACLSHFPGVPGRFEQYVLRTGARCVIDYAHTPGSFNAMLKVLRARTDYLLVVFGAGGNRDAAKRAVMGALAAQWADVVVITSDNPRFEDPHAIAQQIYQGIPVHEQHKVVLELDRAQAINYAWSKARTGSIIALLGKGPDEYQEIEGVKYPFSERTLILSLDSNG